MSKMLCNVGGMGQINQSLSQIATIGVISGIIAYKTISPKNKKRALYSTLLGFAGGVLGRVVINQPAVQKQVCGTNNTYKSLNTTNTSTMQIDSTPLKIDSIRF